MRVTDEVRLPEGRSGISVWRSPDGVHRTSGPWTPTVHAYLHHLEVVGFDGAPRVLGEDEQGREVLSFIEGDVLAGGNEWQPGTPTPWPAWAQSEVCLVESAKLLRFLHEAASSFVPPKEAMWRQHDCPALAHDEIVCHGDVGPHNTVYRTGVPVALIDWDSARPNQPLVEFGDAAWRYVPLGDDAYFAQSGFGVTPDLAARLAAFARAYGLTRRANVAWSLHQAKQRSVEAARFWPISPTEGASVLRLVADQLAWLDSNVDELVSALD